MCYNRVECMNHSLPSLAKRGNIFGSPPVTSTTHCDPHNVHPNSRVSNSMLSRATPA